MAAREIGPPAEDDVVPGGRVLGALAFALVVGGMMVLVAALVLQSSDRAVRPSQSYPEQALGAPHSVQGVRQGLFDLEPTAAVEQAAARARLERFEWVDRPHRVVSIPIEQAIDLVAGEGR